MDLNLERLLAEAVAKHGIRLDPDDPAVVVITLNRLVLEEAAKSITADVRRAIGEFERAANHVQSKLGEAVAKSLKAGSSRAAPANGRELPTRAALGLSLSVGSFLIGLAVGTWVLR